MKPVNRSEFRCLSKVMHIECGANLLGSRFDADALVIHYRPDDDLSRVVAWAKTFALCRVSPRCRPRLFFTLDTFVPQHIIEEVI